MRNWTVVCSEVSGKKQGRFVVEQQLVPAWEKIKSLPPLDIQYTQHAGHAIALAKEAGEKGNGVIAVGGDGTVHEVIQGLMEAKALKTTPMGILSQGTMNFYAISAGLPDAVSLPQLISENSFRPSPLLKVYDDSNILSTHCFECCNMAPLSFNGATGAQTWRFRPGGSMVGIFLNLIHDNLRPSVASQAGELKLYGLDGKTHSIKDRFFWVSCGHRNPYTGTLGETFWVSYLTVKGHPGFSRMMDFLKPPMELLSGNAYAFEGHFECSKMEFAASEDDCTYHCIDGDPMRAGKKITLEHMHEAMLVVAPKEFPKKNPPDMVGVSYITEPAEKWLENNPPPKGVELIKPDGVRPKKSSLLPILGVLCCAVVGYYIVQHESWSS